VCAAYPGNPASAVMPKCPPSVQDEGSFWPVSCLDIERSGDDATKILYFRKEALDLWTTLSSMKGPALSILGAPGIRKSCEVWACKLHNDMGDDDEFTIWVQIQGKYPVVCGFDKKN
jgi:hypothetical protein